MKRQILGRPLVLLAILVSAHFLMASAQAATGTDTPSSFTVAGQVERIDSRLEGGTITSFVSLYVMEVKSGSQSLAGKTIVVKYIGGASGGLILVQSDQPVFHVGENVEVNLEQQGSLYTVVHGIEGKVSLNSNLQPLSADIASGYKLYWYKPGMGVNEATARPGPDWYGPLRWGDADMPIRYWFDPRNTPAGLESSIEFIIRAYQTWQDDPASGFTVSYNGNRTDRDWGISDGINIFCWRFIDGNSGILGVTRSYFGYIPDVYDSLRLVDSDIELDTSDYWSATEAPAPDRIDVQAVATHEIGHLVGLADLYSPEDSAMTMFGYTSTGDVTQRTLEWGDQAGLRQLHPSGTVTQPPTAYIDSITPNPATQGQIVSFSGHGSDSDGSIVAYEWRSSIDGVLSSSASFSSSSLSVGTHTIYFRVRDNNSEWSTEATRTLTINTLTTPFDFSLVNSGNMGIAQGHSGSNTITVNLASGTSQTVALTASGLPSGVTASFNPPSGNPAFTSTLTLSTSPSTPAGSYTITVTGSGNGKTHASQFTLTVNTTGSGAITIYSLSESYVGQDPESGKSNDLAASVRVDYFSGGQSQSTSQNTYFTIIADAGTAITFTIVSSVSGWAFNDKWDWYGHMQYSGTTFTFQVSAGSYRVAAFFIQANQNPTAYIDSISPNPADYGQLVSFNGRGVDPDGSIATYEWRSNIDGPLGTSSSISSSSLSPGSHTVYLRVQDNDGGWSPETTATLTVNPSQPISTFQVYSLPFSYLGEDPGSVKSNDVGALVQVDYIYQGQSLSKTNNTYFVVTADIDSKITFKAVSAPKDWAFADRWDYYGHARYDGVTVTLDVTSGTNRIVAFYTETGSPATVNIQVSTTTVDIKNGGQLSVTVSTTPPITDLGVVLEVTQDKQQWNTWASGSTDSYGKFTTTLSFTTQGVYYLRAKWTEGTTESTTITVVESPCIIATVAYGGPEVPEVKYMRYVRDNVIGASVTGRNLVHGWNSFYYSWSPTVAALAVKSASLKLMLRVLLFPLIGITRVAAYAFGVTSPVNVELASFFGFFIAATLSISLYIVTPVAIVFFSLRQFVKRIFHKKLRLR